MQNAAIRDTVTKTSADLPGPLRELLDKTPIGHLTPPEITKQGVEMVALCGRKPTTVDTPKKREIREKMFPQKYEKKSKSYLRRNPQSRDDRISLMMAKPLALTSGEPAGIGPDIAIAAWLRRNELNLPPFYLLGDRAFFAERAKILGLKVEFADASPEDARRDFRERLAGGRDRRSRRRRGPARRTPPAPMRRSPRSARRSTMSGPDKASAVVTNPIAKSVLYRAGFRHPGHTEFLAELAGQWRRCPAAGDDAVVAGARRRAGDDPSFAARGARRSSRPT